MRSSLARRPIRAVTTQLILLCTLAFGPACNLDPVENDDTVGDAELRVLFIGNSLTYVNGVPAMVQTIAEAAGHTFAYGAAVMANASLEDHWYAGVESTIRDVAADVVVLQQGPSSLPQNQLHLRTWTETLTEVIREVGGEPALFMVWPEATRIEAFDAVYDAYHDAAVAVNGIFAPAGDAWRQAWDDDPALEFYGPDGFHPSVLGSQVAALTLFRVLFDESLVALPSRLEPHSNDLPVVDLGGEAPLIYRAVEDAIASVTETPAP